MPAETLTRAPLTDPSRIYRYRDGLYAVDLLTAAIVHLNFFTWLAANPSDLDGISAGLGLARRPADVLLTLLTANGFVTRQGTTFVVTDVAREHLVAGSPFNLTPYYASLAERPVVQDFVRVLRTGTPAHWAGAKDGKDWHASMEEPAFARRFTAAMDCRGHYLAQALAARLDLTGRSRLLDVGGGLGIYACVLVAHHPHMSAVVFDQPPVDCIARTLVAERECGAQVQVEAGNFFTDAWPSGCDVHLLSNVLHDWDTPDVARILRASADALPRGNARHP